MRCQVNFVPGFLYMVKPGYAQKAIEINVKGAWDLEKG